MSKFYPAILKKAKTFLFAFSFFLLPGTMLFSQDTVLINTSGPWTVPAGVTSVKVELWGGGGGGGGAWLGAGGGGGGGSYKTQTLTVEPGQIYTVTIGIGGPGGIIGTDDSQVAAGSGGATTFTGPTTVTTLGGGPRR